MISELSLRFEEIWIIMNTFLYHICSLHQKEEWKIPGSDISGTKEKPDVLLKTKTIMGNVVAKFGVRKL